MSFPCLCGTEYGGKVTSSHFIDVAGNTNYFGTGLNEAARILAYGQKEFEKLYPHKSSANLLFVGENVFSQVNIIVDHIKKFHDKIRIIKLENVEDKHGTKRNIYVIENLPERMAFNLFTPQERFS